MRWRSAFFLTVSLGLVIAPGIGSARLRRQHQQGRALSRATAPTFKAFYKRILGNMPRSRRERVFTGNVLREAMASASSNEQKMLAAIARATNLSLGLSTPKGGPATFKAVGDGTTVELSVPHKVVQIYARRARSRLHKVQIDLGRPDRTAHLPELRRPTYDATITFLNPGRRPEWAAYEPVVRHAISKATPRQLEKLSYILAAPLEANGGMWSRDGRMVVELFRGPVSVTFSARER